MADSNNKRIVKNTLFLYVRMIVVMCVSLYTSRLVLKILGAEDYGIYNVVGGVVTLMMFIDHTLSSTCQRYFSTALAKKDEHELNRLFCSVITLYVVFLSIVLLLGETVGLWFVNNKLIIPEERMYATNWVYQLTLVTIFSQSLSIPFKSLIISYEKMSFFAYVSIVEAMLKLGLVLLLPFISFDKLILYALLMAFVYILITTAYAIVSSWKFKCVRIRFLWDNSMLKDIGTYSGWHLLGSMSVVIKKQGINILLNTFFNPVVNASRAISVQVMAAAEMLTNNFFVAVKPQIFKLYSTQEKQKMFLLVERSSKMCFILVGIIAFPVLYNTDYLLTLWLSKYPDFALVFTQLILIESLFNSVNGPSIAAAMASKRIMKFQIVTSLIMMANLPISYLFLRIGFQPQITYFVSISLSIITIIVRSFLLKEMISYPVVQYFKCVCLPLLLCGISTTIPLWLFNDVVSQQGFSHFFFRASIAGILFSLMSVLFVFNRTERDWALGLIKSKFRQRSHT